MTYLPRKIVKDKEGNITYLSPFIVCEDEHDVQFKIVFLTEGIKIQECFNHENKGFLKYNLN
jgi:hypothetical protein